MYVDWIRTSKTIDSVTSDAFDCFIAATQVINSKKSYYFARFDTQYNLTYYYYESNNSTVNEEARGIKIDTLN